MNNTTTQTFRSKTYGEIKVIMINGEPHFPATECAKLLGYSNPRKAILDHCEADGVTNRYVIDRLGREQKVKYITEANLYRLITHSKLPGAQKFEKWVYEVVLPTVRKYGAYIEPEILDKIRDNPAFAEELVRKLRDEQEKTKLLGRKIDALEPKAMFCDDVLNCENLIPVSIIAKDYGFSATAFNRLLHDLRVQYKLGGTWLLYEEYAGNGYTKTRTYPVSESKSAVHTYWTFEGQKFLYEFLKYYGITPSYGYNADDDDVPF